MFWGRAFYDEELIFSEKVNIWKMLQKVMLNSFVE